MHTNRSGGFSDRAQTEVAVSPCGPSGVHAVITETPLAWRLKNDRNPVASIGRVDDDGADAALMGVFIALASAPWLLEFMCFTGAAQ